MGLIGCAKGQKTKIPSETYDELEIKQHNISWFSTNQWLLERSVPMITIGTIFRFICWYFLIFSHVKLL